MSESEQGQRRLNRGGRPVLIMGEDSERTQGRDAQTSNIAAGKAVAEAVRTTLGPRGMDKMLVGSAGDVVITNDGATILNEMDIEHPAAQMLVEVAETQEEEVGDGTTTASVLAGELLANAEDLLEDDVHPTTIVEGYAAARDIGLEAVEDLVLDGDADDELLAQVAETSMTGKGTGGITAGKLADAIVRAVRRIETDAGVERDDVHVVTQTGESSAATELVDGVAVESEPVREDMPRGAEDVTVAVVDTDLENRETEIDAEYNINSAEQLSAAVEAEERELREYAEALDAADVDAVFVTGNIQDGLDGFLKKRGIVGFDQVDDDEARAIERATGATRLAQLDEVESEEVGHVDALRVESFGDDDVTFVEGGAAAEAVTLFVRGGTEHVIDELERAISDGIDVVVAALDRGGVVPGAAATEIHVADAVRDEAASIEGRKQLAVEAFADAMDVIPRTLATNTGMDPIDVLVDLRAANESGLAGVVSAGESGEIADPVEAGILDPAAVKREAVGSATEAATMIARIDDVISAE